MGNFIKISQFSPKSIESLVLNIYSTGIMARKLLFFALFSFILTRLYANDTFFYIAGGNLVPVEQNQTNVEMREETINMELFDSYYSVTVDFIFYNNSRDENLLVGFPYLLQKQGGMTVTSIYDFKTWVNDVPVEYSSNSIKISEQGIFERIANHAFTKNVYFPSREITRIRVQYNADYGEVPYEIMASYYYGSGRPWDKNIGKITINIRNNIKKFDAWIYQFDIPRINASNHIKWQGDTMRITLENVEPAEDDILQIYLADRLWNHYPPVLTANRFRDRAGVLDRSKLSLLSSAQLRLLRNAFYALYGYNFRDENLKSIFMDVFKVFYTVNSNFNENLFTEAERRNINMILEEERSR
jgi:hypothetical protein